MKDDIRRILEIFVSRSLVDFQENGLSASSIREDVYDYTVNQLIETITKGNDDEYTEEG